MDPRACLERVLAALDRKDTAEALVVMTELLGWLLRGGSVPHSTVLERAALEARAYQMAEDLDG